MRKIIHGFVFLTLCFGFYTQAKSQFVTKEFTSLAIKDAVVSSLNPTVNYGFSTDFVAMAWTSNTDEVVLRSMIQFYLNEFPEDVTIVEAKLQLYANEGSGKPEHFGFNEARIKQITEPWDEHSVTWDNQPATASSGSVTLEMSTSPDENYMDIDVTDIVKKFIDAPSSNMGFMLELSAETVFKSINFASTDHPNQDIHPKLVIVYETEDEDDGTVTTGIEDNNPDVIKATVFPNPFVESLNISYMLDQKSVVRISLYDLEGKGVRNIVDEIQLAGEYNLQVQAENLDLTSELYVLTIFINNKPVFSRKLVHY